MFDEPAPERLSEEESLAVLFEDVECHQYELNRYAARRAGALADVVEYARAHPGIYVLAGETQPVATAERCAVLEASARFQLAEGAVRQLVHVAGTARVRLPRLWARAWQGFATIAQIEAAVTLLARFGDGDAAVDAFDDALARAVPDCSPAAFRAKARRLARTLAPADEAAEHARAFEGRHVWVEDVADGMSWTHILSSTADAHVAKRRLTATAKHLAKTLRDGRTRDQIRADLASAWLRGVGTPAAVKTKVFVTVPLDRLAPAAQATVRRNIAAGHRGIDLDEEPQLLGTGPVDAGTAIRELLLAGKFTRVITDPVTGVVLDMDRRARTVTRAQYEWLILTHATCTRDGCTRPAIDADIDHWIAYARRGLTNLSNLHPLCTPEHVTKDTTRLRYRRRRNGTVQLASPTGFTTRGDPDDGYQPGEDPPWFTVLDTLRAHPPVYSDTPPF